MTDRRINRRHVLRGAGVLGVGGALAALGDPRPAHAGGFAPANSLVGSWLTMVTNSPGPQRDTRPFPVLVTFDAGGGMTESDLGGTGHGAWTKTGDTTYALKFLSLATDTKGNFVGIVTLTGAVTIHADGMTASGTSTFTFTSPAGKVLETYGQTLTATRISV